VCGIDDARRGDSDGVKVIYRATGVGRLGDPDKGRRYVGVRRQCVGTAGRIENAQLAVYLTYAAPTDTSGFAQEGSESIEY
jgi:SRSO17 transposase